MIVASTRADLNTARAGLRAPVGVVMTMGALHDGHAALLCAARERSGSVVATIFVNPLQFGPGEDFDRYPRTMDADVTLCEQMGVDVVFAPAREELYPDGEPSIRVAAGPLGDILEGASRPGHFDGVLTVVLKLLHLVRPDAAFFGEKDYQQLTLIRRLAHDTDLPVEVVGVPTVREPDGLAMSSRNRYLAPSERVTALALSTALRAGVAAAGEGAPAAVTKARETFARLGADAKLDYLVLTDPDLGPAPVRGGARLLVAAWVGGTRLIDNLALELP